MSTVAQVSTSGFVEAELLAGVWAIVVSARIELLLFVVAMVSYFALFMQRTPTSSKLAKKIKVIEQSYKEEDYPTDTYTRSNDVKLEKDSNLEKAVQDAFESADYRSVLRCWNTMKTFEKMPSVSLPHVVESMQRFKKDTPFILRELKSFLKKFPSEYNMSYINDLLESLAKRLDSDMMEKIVDMISEIDLTMDHRSYEVFLNMYFTTRSFQEVISLISQMKAKQIPFTTSSSMVVIKTFLKTNNFDAAVQHFHHLKSTWVDSSTPARGHVVSLLVDLACKEHRLTELVSELRGVTISEDVVNTMFAECVRQRNFALTSSVEMLAREQGVQFTGAMYGLLMKGMATDPIRVQALFDEALEKGVEVTADFANSVLASCVHSSNVQMAETFYGKMKPTQLSILSAYIRFYADHEQYDKACDVYEHDLLRLHATTTLDARMERSLMNAALKCGRSHLAKDMLNASPSDIAKHITMIRNCAAENNLKGAVSVFESLERSGVNMNCVIYNTVLDACVECRDLEAAEVWMQQMKKVGMTDVVSFNTLIKAHLHCSNFDQARCLMAEMSKEGLQPNPVTFNELINAMVKGSSDQRRQMWDIVEEMKIAGVKPNQITISILLKNLQAHSGETEVSKTMDLINTMDEPMDEVLLSSVVEACVRIRQPALLELQLKQLQDSSNPVAINGSHTYGSLIKAYGFARDIAGIWRCWKEMRSRHIKPTSITFGCMVEAIVSNGDTEGAYDLIHQIQEDEQCRGALNSVIYCSVLKGFTREKKIDRAFAVYEEIGDNKIELSIVMYNTLVDACARCGRMERVPNILEDMKNHHVKPNLITYSTMLKGHCQHGDIQQGFLILEQMNNDAHLKPDEIMYNSLLDGCAQNNLVDEGLRLLEEMQSKGVRPSNFTLSILVKLMNRARKLEQAFSLVEDITKKYNFKPNVHVYTNLVQACVSNQQFNRGMGILEQMVKERIVPDTRTYAILVRANISKGLHEQAVGVMRGALGLQGALPFLQQSIAVCPNLDNALVNETLASLSDCGHAQDLAVPLLSDIRRHSSWVRIDVTTQRKVMSPCLSSNTSRAEPSSSTGKGKGKGNRPWNCK